MTSVYTVANVLLSTARAQQKSLTPLQLMKLAYMSHGWMLAMTGKPLFNNRIEAWKYGPVIPDLYTQIKKYGSNPMVIPPKLRGVWRRTHAAICFVICRFSF